MQDAACKASLSQLCATCACDFCTVQSAGPCTPLAELSFWTDEQKDIFVKARLRRATAFLELGNLMQVRRRRGIGNWALRNAGLDCRFAVGLGEARCLCFTACAQQLVLHSCCMVCRQPPPPQLGSASRRRGCFVRPFQCCAAQAHCDFVKGGNLGKAFWGAQSMQPGHPVACQRRLAYLPPGSSVTFACLCHHVAAGGDRVAQRRGVMLSQCLVPPIR